MTESIQQSCFFTKEQASFKMNSIRGQAEYYSLACGGHYYLVQDAIYYLNMHTDGGKMWQGLLNCARRSLELNKEGIIPVWTTRENVKNLQGGIDQENEHKTNARPQLVCSVEEYFEESIDHSAKPMTLLSSFGNRLEKTQAYSKFRILNEDRIWARIVDREELASITKHLYDQGLLIYVVPSQHQGMSQIFEQIQNTDLQLTPKGWEELRKKNSFPTGNKVFIASQFEWPNESDLHQQTMSVIKKVCKKLGFEADLVSQGHTNNITDKIIAEIKRSRFVIAELTYNNRGVYFESGFARGLGIPVFHIVREGFTDGEEKEGRKIHFDVAQINYRKWKTPEDLETKLTDWIEASVGKFSKQ